MTALKHFSRLQIILLAVLLAHAVLFVTKMRVDTVVDHRWDEAAAIQVRLEDLAPETDPKKIKQIVQSEDSAKQEKPKDEAFLGEKDRSFDRQTAARNIDTFNRAAKGNAQIDSQHVAKQAQAVKKALKNLKFSDLGFEASGAPAVAQQPAPSAQKGLQNGDENSRGLSSTNDYLEDMPLGDFTQLNTVEFKYYGFFHRIRQKLEQFWGRTLQEKAEQVYRSGRRLPASENHITSLLITMNQNGEITKVHVKSSSGVKELDDAAIESFNQAGPFPNPPQGLLVNGHAVIEWGFVVKS